MTFTLIQRVVGDVGQDYINLQNDITHENMKVSKNDNCGIQQCYRQAY